MNNVPIKITDTVLRDAHQSLLATRMRIDDMLPIAARLDEVGYYSLEMWGGATFDSAMRFLNEDPWERIRRLKEVMPKTPFQMLLRGQNIVGYKHYADDIVDRFVERAKANGIDIFRIFDALNDTRNMARAMWATKQVGGHAQATISYTISPVHTIDGFVSLARDLTGMGADSICIKDMAGLLSPFDAYELVSKLKSALSIPIQLHTHYTSGMASAACVKAAEAGVDIIDTAISSLAGLTSQPPTETMVRIFDDSPRRSGLNLDILAEIADYFAGVRKKYNSFESGLMGVDVNVLRYQIPGGMLSNLISQLREQGAMDRYQDVLGEMPRVRADLGYPPLVTPSSQIVGTQATLNVLMGQRYKVVPQEVKNYVKGLYGRPPAPIDPEIRKLIIGDEQPIDCRPADLLPPEFEKARQEIGILAESDEDVLLYAIFPQVARPFLERRARKSGGKEEIIAAIAARVAKERVALQNAAQATSHLGSLWKHSRRRKARAFGGWGKW
jgi:oxaloacetate decarboxylase (Na+ extruding) subunit alpha